MTILQSADVAPTANQRAAIQEARANAAKVMARWRMLSSTTLAALNAKLQGAGMTRIELRQPGKQVGE